MEEEASTTSGAANSTSAAIAAPPLSSVPKKQPDWDVTYSQKVKKVLDVSLLHTFIHDR